MQKRETPPLQNPQGWATQNLRRAAPPARILTKKSGKSKQAKKLYLVTTAGIKYVEDRLNGAHAG